MQNILYYINIGNIVMEKKMINYRKINFSIYPGLRGDGSRFDFES